MSKKVLFVRMSYMGDILHATPAARMIKQAHPDWELTWIVTPSLVDMLKENPYVDQVITWERDAYEAHSKKLHVRTMWTMWWELYQRLRSMHFDIAVDVQGRLITGLVLAASGAPLRLGMGGTKELNWLFTNQKTSGTYGHVIERYNQVAQLLAPGVAASNRMILNLTNEEKSWAREVLQVASNKSLGKYRGKKPIIALVPGTSWPSKEWPLDHWTELAQRLSLVANIVYIGGGRERSAADQLPHSDSVYDWVGRTTLRETAALINQSDLVVSGDTGALHMASALQRPIVALFGPTDPRLWGPLNENAVTLVAETVSCRVCRKRKCPKKHGNCMQAITVDRVEQTVYQQLKAISEASKL